MAPFPRTPLDVVSGLFPVDTSTAHPRSRKKKPPRKRRPKPTNKRVWASLAREPKEVMEQAFAEAAARDPERRLEWIVLVDGETNQLRILRTVQKTYNFRIVLDFFHVLERLWAAARALCPDDEWKQQDYARTRPIASSRVGAPGSPAACARPPPASA